MFTPRVDRYGQIPVRTNRYSVPIRLIGKRAGHAARLSPGGLRPERGSGPPRASDREGRGPPGSGPLPGSPGSQARRLPRLNRSRAGPFGGQVHPGPRRLVGPGQEDARRARWHPGADRGPPTGSSPAPRTCRRGSRSGPAGRCHGRRRGCFGGPQGRPGRDRTHPGGRPAGSWHAVGDGDVPARMATRPPSYGHQAAALGGPL
ncbi:MULTISPECIES: hypothetical protein [unclassified Streptomyces]|uniref:hypothetical protein n=1 Tax=unclassified Streptomyces TaxID=2593676 RepID=UPI003FA36B9E